MINQKELQHFKQLLSKVSKSYGIGDDCTLHHMILVKGAKLGISIDKLFDWAIENSDLIRDEERKLTDEYYAQDLSQEQLINRKNLENKYKDLLVESVNNNGIDSDEALKSMLLLKGTKMCLFDDGLTKWVDSKYNELETLPKL